MYRTIFPSPLSVPKTIAYALAYSSLRYSIPGFYHCPFKRRKKEVNSIFKTLLRNLAYNIDSPLQGNLFSALQVLPSNGLFLQTAVLRNFWWSDFFITLYDCAGLQGIILPILHRDAAPVLAILSEAITYLVRLTLCVAFNG